jgi:hypothetical protein
VTWRIAAFISKARETVELHPFSVAVSVLLNAQDDHLEHLVPVHQKQEAIWRDEAVVPPVSTAMVMRSLVIGPLMNV